ncbi:MAG: TIGR00341 family protein [Wenzhouxiangellaceae bacterium]|nr:TIGR00341 family protein [Wenzhouxiangellaceae bacterium]
MGLRRIELVADAAGRERCTEAVLAAEPIDWWVQPLGASGERAGESCCVVAIIDSGRVEGLLDAISSAFDAGAGLRVVVTSVDATLPPPVEPDDEEGEDDDETETRRISRVELVDALTEQSRLGPRYLWLVALSTVVAAIGLVQGQVAVIVGAMVIAPLLAPNMALALAVTLGDPRLGGRAVGAGMSGIALASLIAVLAGTILAVDPTISEIASRTRVDPLDLALALAAGAAGAMAVTSGLPSALIGVMVAVALLPPLVVAMLLIGAGAWSQAAGALILYSANVAAVNLASIAVFLAQGLSPRSWWEKRRARRLAWAGMLFWILALAGLVALLYLRDARP